MVAQIRKRHLFCCCLCGFILGVVTIIGVIVGLVTYLRMTVLDSLENRGNNTLPEVDTYVYYEDWSLYRGDYYYFSNYTLSWNNAQDTCTKMVSHLVDVDDRSEAAWLTQITTQNNNDNTWIGGRTRNGTGFQWYDNKGYHRDMIYANWAPGQPSLPDQNCVQMSKKQNYKWDNEFCHQERQFICKRTT